MLTTDRYIKVALTVIAAALVVLAVNPWLTRLHWRPDGVVTSAEAQTTPAPAPAPPTSPAPAAPGPVAPGPVVPGPVAPRAPGAVQGIPGVPTRPAGAPPQMPPPSAMANFQWWDECVAVSKETVPAAWGKLIDLAPGAFVFESEDTIRLVRTAPYEAVPLGPNNKPCKLLEIKKTK